MNIVNGNAGVNILAKRPILFPHHFRKGLFSSLKSREGSHYFPGAQVFLLDVTHVLGKKIDPVYNLGKNSNFFLNS